MQLNIQTYYIVLILIFQLNNAFSQQNYWQQKADYNINVKINVNDHTFSGDETINYTNNSPDTLNYLYFHLFFNAFKPNSKMDIRSRSIKDPDQRVGSRISKLLPEEQGDLTITKVNQIVYKSSTLQKTRLPAKFITNGTILKLFLPTGLVPSDKIKLEVQFQGQVPLQIRRAGRDNLEGISYSMTQWYPKIAEYDFTGWHNDFYIGREFHGVWGDYNVNIEIDKKYIVAGTGVLKNANEIGYGYSSDTDLSKNSENKKNITWNFVANNVIDFAFAADPDYIHSKYQVPNGPMLHFFYQDGESVKYWEALPKKMHQLLDYMTENVGPYPYPQYSFIQGGDGGMEYPMCTLITGNRSENSLTSVAIHEFIHSWFQMIFATNESLYPWMDEGFTTYYTAQIQRILKGDKKPIYNVGQQGYISMVKLNIQEPATTHADRYELNRTYAHTAYSKGAVFLGLIRQLVGEDFFLQGMKRYYHDWAFKHPTPNDFIRCFEKVSGFELSWLIEYFINTTKTVDYAVDEIKDLGVTETEIKLKRIEDMPLPILVSIKTKEKNYLLYIPIDLTRGHYKMDKEISLQRPWQWVSKDYRFIADIPIDEIISITIDPYENIPDINRVDNIYVKPTKNEE